MTEEEVAGGVHVHQGSIAGLRRDLTEEIARVRQRQDAEENEEIHRLQDELLSAREEIHLLRIERAHVRAELADMKSRRCDLVSKRAAELCGGEPVNMDIQIEHAEGALRAMQKARDYVHKLEHAIERSYGA